MSIDRFNTTPQDRYLEDYIEGTVQTVAFYWFNPFHIEFFHRGGEDYVGLEINMRPPGGFTTDMFN